MTVAISNLTTFFGWLLLSYFLFTTATGSPLGDNPLSKRQTSQSPFVVTGVPSGKQSNGAVPFRLEIRELQKNTNQWNLFMLSLSRLQSIDPAQALSYYQLAGIHGRPFKSWDNVPSKRNPQVGGYCTHASILFPPWHRPYLALYEQVLYDTMQKVVSEFSGADREKYAAAAKDFRIPYWDWAAAPPTGESVLPPSIGGSDTVTVDTPKGALTIRNPLYSYTFQPLVPADLPDQPFVQWSTTLRYPSSNLPGATSRNSLVAAQLDNSRVAIRDRLYNLFAAYGTYSNFSNKGWIPNGAANFDSVESLHDQVHGLCGNGGHMSVIDYSSFDPIFFLHHAMMDRVFAIWQVLYPTSYVEPVANQAGTFTAVPGTVEDVDTDLTPFHSDAAGNFWTSKTVRDLKTFNYTYAELADWGLSTQQVRNNVITTVNKLYGSTSPAKMLQRRGPVEGEAAPSLDRRQDTTNPSSDKAPKDPLKDERHREYIANIQVQNHALPTSFFVHIFVGDFDPTPDTWSFEPNLVGSHCVFAHSQSNGTCSMCKAEASHEEEGKVTGTIPLTSALLEDIKAGRLKSLEPVDVEPYLKQNLHWRVTSTDDADIARDTVPNLKVSVVSSEVTKPANEHELPSWGPFTTHYDVTDARPAGLGRDG
ncbi:MAG: hypothetical protein M1817_002104 [Caeruleum heppii]|nr:MAG: hypothetical protein M1817_002104 [Caeruleum heppii]